MNVNSIDEKFHFFYAPFNRLKTPPSFVNSNGGIAVAVAVKDNVTTQREQLSFKKGSGVSLFIRFLFHLHIHMHTAHTHTHRATNKRIDRDSRHAPPTHTTTAPHLGDLLYVVSASFRQRGYNRGECVNNPGKFGIFPASAVQLLQPEQYICEYKTVCRRSCHCCLLLLLVVPVVFVLLSLLLSLSPSQVVTHRNVRIFFPSEWHSC